MKPNNLYSCVGKDETRNLTMEKITDKIAALPPHGTYFSLEFFPPKTDMVCKTRTLPILSTNNVRVRRISKHDSLECPEHYILSSLR